MTLDDDEDPTRVRNPLPPVGVGDVIRERFVLEAELGSGGMGRVFKALDLRAQEAHDRHPYVAVKLLTHSFRQHPASLMALQREAKRAQTLAHPNIIRVFDFDRDGSLIYLVMEYLRGRTLNGILVPGFSGLALDKAMAIIRPVGEALTFAHDRGIVHSDLKPSNIFSTDDGQVKVIDFGIARAFRRPGAADGEATLFDASSLRAFSPLHASPEMIDGDEADPRDDIFSLACITYELISGNHPFGRKSAAIARGKGQQPEKLPGLTGLQWSAVRRGLAFSRAERTATIESFLTGLDPRPAWKNLRPPPARRTATVASFLAGLDPRPAWKNLRLLAARRTATVASFLAGLDPRPAWKNLRLLAARRTATVASFLAGLDPRPAWKNLRLLVARRTATVASFLAGLDPRPAWKNLRLLVARRTATVASFLAGLDPRPAWKNLRLLAVTGALAVALATGLIWLTQSGTEQPTPSPEPTPEAEPSPAPSPEPAPNKMAAAPQAPDRPPAPSEAAIPPEGGPPASPFRDCDQCPEMVVVPEGRFEMGAPATDTDAEPDDPPLREVAIDKAFALGRYEVTEGQWGACARDGVCSNVPAMGETAFSNYPKTHVNWQDAQAFIRWLNEKTGRSYRLPTEAEWEYAARAGTDTPYPWGDQIGWNNANCRDCGAQMGGRPTAPVGSFAPNRFGLFDMVGNVWEWTTDCGGNQKDTGKGASPTCARRVVRGGSWDNSASAVRVTQRLSARADIREDNVGFRVARDMP